jgi:D-isomer specific 2-hydroxyacid dehydrogenase, NAD binding domain
MGSVDAAAFRTRGQNLGRGRFRPDRRAVAVRLKPFGLAKVLYYEPRQAPKEVEEQYGVEYSALPALLKSSDIVSLRGT